LSLIGYITAQVEPPKEPPMPVFVMKWNDNDVSFAATGTKQEATLVMDELGEASEMEKVDGRLGTEFGITLRYDPNTKQIIVPRYSSQFEFMTDFLRRTFPEAFEDADGIEREDVEHRERREQLSDRGEHSE
jgi:hypothetical protein